MQFQEFSSKQESFDLPYGFTLQRAAAQEFARAWAVYRRVNVDFAQSFAEVETELSEEDPCFWVTREGQRVGGVVLQPNEIGDFFLIPPHDDPQQILDALWPLLGHWSMPDKPVCAHGIISNYLGLFQLAGFNLQTSRLWMIRPTELWTVSWPPEWRVTALHPGKHEPIAALFAETYGGDGDEQAVFNTHLASVEKFFAGYVAGSDCGRASGMVVEQGTGKLAAVCMLSIHKQIPAISYLAVAPPYQNHGLGTRLIKRAIGQLARSNGYLKLAISTDNPAVDLFHDLGFVRGNMLHQLVKPVEG